MKYIAITLLAVSLFACGTKKDGVTISGTFDDPITDQYVKIELIKNEELSVVDSFFLDNSGTFSRVLKIEEQGFYRLNFYSKTIINMILNDEDVALFKTEDLKEPYRIKGSKGTDYIYSLSTIKSDFETKVKALNDQFMEARNNGDNDILKTLQEEFLVLKASSDKSVKSAILNMDGSIAGILGLSFLDQESEFAFVDSVATKYGQELPNSPYTISLQNQVKDLGQLAVGSPAPEISLPDPNGNTIALSSFKGSYVLVDFWAAWCRPCRQENPNVVRMYNAYHGKGFEILSVSLDRTKDAWVKAIEQDGLTWNHVSDLQYFNSEAAQTYQINAIPATYLIGPDGNIVAKNLRGAALEAKLKEIFG
ncbi:MAG: TlpA family protein disulfide reductase [Reichenbachiella sp.]